MWCHVELIEVKKYNYAEYYNMDGDTIWNGGGQITSVIIMRRVIMDAEDIKIETAEEYIEEEDRRQQ